MAKKFNPRAYCNKLNDRAHASKAERVLMNLEKRAATPFSSKQREEKLAEILADLRRDSDPMRGVRELLWEEHEKFVARACAELGNVSEDEMWELLTMADPEPDGDDEDDQADEAAA